MHNYFGFALFQQLCDTRDLDAAERATDVIGMSVVDERMGDFHLVLRRDLENRVDLPSRIDHRDLARLDRTDQIDVVLHRTDFELFEVERRIHGEEFSSQHSEAGSFLSPVLILTTGY